MIGTMESYRDDFARIWMLSSENIVKCKRIIAKHSAWMFNLLQAHYFRLHNIIPVENTMTIKWLEMNGFMFGDTHIINDYEFIEFFRLHFSENWNPLREILVRCARCPRPTRFSPVFLCIGAFGAGNHLHIMCLLMHIYNM